MIGIAAEGAALRLVRRDREAVCAMIGRFYGISRLIQDGMVQRWRQMERGGERTTEAVLPLAMSDQVQEFGKRSDGEIGVFVGCRGERRDAIGVGDEDGGDAGGVGGSDVSSGLVADHQGAFGWDIQGFEGDVDDGGVGFEPADIPGSEYFVEVVGEVVVAKFLGDFLGGVGAVGGCGESGAG